MPARATVVLSFSDGRAKRIDFEPVSVEDPSIVERLESKGGPRDREIVTTFRRASQRPASYPAGLPFVPGVRAHTNEYPGSDRGPRAAWIAFGRSARLFDEVQRQSLEAGWRQDPSIRPPRLADALNVAFLRRGEHVRTIAQRRLGWLRTLVELEDVPAAYVDRPES